MHKTRLTTLDNFHVQPLNQKQDQFLRHMRSDVLTVAVGSAGTGKTYCAASMAASLLASGHVLQIVLTRPNLSTGRSLGYFPGTVEEKLSCWLAPLMSVLKARFGETKFQYLIRNEKIVLQPLETIRGRSFEDAFIIVDEAQNLTVEEFRALCTRVGEGSRIVFLGDPTQRDLAVSGLDWFVNLCRNHDISCGVVEFTSDDIVRSELVKQLVKAMEKERQRTEAEENNGNNLRKMSFMQHLTSPLITTTS